MCAWVWVLPREREGHFASTFRHLVKLMIWGCIHLVEKIIRKEQWYLEVLETKMLPQAKSCLRKKSTGYSSKI